MRIKRYVEFLCERTMIPHDDFAKMLKDVLDNKVDDLVEFLKDVKPPLDLDGMKKVLNTITGMFEPYKIRFLMTSDPHKGNLNPAGLGDARYNFQTGMIDVEFDPNRFIPSLLRGLNLDSLEDLIGHEMVHKMQWDAIRKAKRVRKTKAAISAQRKDFYEECVKKDGSDAGATSCDLEVHKKLMHVEHKFYVNDPMEVMAWAWTICIGLRKYVD